ncbi:MAG: hypothetical protein FWF94_00190 [Oscillospiraceae bacterium]|nr:hypothetical protein [Oscillospiraceae bacterium]
MKYFSMINSFNVYECESNRDTITLFGKKSLKLNNARSGKMFYTKPFPPEFLREFDNEKERWFNIIRNPINIKGYLWPADIIDLSGNSFKKDYALLMPLKSGLGGYESMCDSLTNTSLTSADIDTEANAALVKSLIEAWCGLDGVNYLYHEFSFNNMFYNMDNEVIFDFSFSAHEYSDLSDGARVSMSRINPDYTDVYYYQIKSTKMDVISDYFSMAVILFRLLTGRLPYQGRLLEGVHNITKQDHSEWIRKYHRYPIFIFDENENVNRISSTEAYPEKYVKRWLALHPVVRGMFAAVFKTDNALRQIPPIFYTPHDWRNALL